MNTMRQTQQNIEQARNKMLQLVTAGKDEAIKYLISVAAERGSDDTAIECICYTPGFMDGDPCRKGTEYRIYNNVDHADYYSDCGEIPEEEVELFKGMDDDDISAVHAAIDIVCTAMYECCFREYDDNFMVRVKKNGVEITSYDCGY